MTTGGDPPGVLARVLAGLMKPALSDPPPVDPMPTLAAWFEDARTSGRYADFNTMGLATASADGAPSVRMILCKAVETSPPALVFYTNYTSRKGRELEANPRAAAVFHWPHAGRQARVEGNVVRTSAAESDEHFRSRALLSRVGAWASHQSEPLARREDLIGRALAVVRTMALKQEIERPPTWGGYRILATSVELWVANEGRLHDRVRWERTGAADAWSVTRLNP